MFNPDELTTITLTNGERVKPARCVVMAAAMVDALGDATDDLIDLSARIQPEGAEV